jgi:hypothetical protein
LRPRWPWMACWTRRRHWSSASPARRTTPHVLVDADRGDAVKAVLVVDQDPLALSQDRVVSGVPRDPEPLGDPRDGQVLAHDRFQRPPQPTARHLGPRLSGSAGVLAPHMSTTSAAVATHRDLERRWSPAQRLVSQPPDDSVARCSLAAAAAAPMVGLHDPAGEHGTVALEALAGDLEAELVESAERGQVRASEGSVRQVEVFQMASVRTSIIGRPRRLPAPRRAERQRPRRHHTRYTVICEEPQFLAPGGPPGALRPKR